MKMRPVPTPRLALALPLALALGSLPACEREDADVSAVKAAAIHLETGTSGGKANATYGKVVQDLGTIGKQTTKTGAAAAALIASSQNGLGDAETFQYQAKEREAGEKSSHVRLLLNAYISRHSAAAAAESFDPASELSRIAEAITQAESKRATVDGEGKALEKQVGDLRAQAQDLLTQANGRQEQFARLSTGLARLGAVEAANAAEQAHAIKREGDILRRQGNELNARADSLAPLVEQKSLEVSMYDAQVRSLRTTTEELRAGADLSRAAASETRAGADKDANEIDALVREIDALRAGELKDAAEKALRTLKGAEASAKAASREAKEQADILIASAQQSIGDVHWTRAVGASSHASLLESLAKAKPAFARSTEYLNRSQAERKQESESKQAAAEAYDAAKAALERAPARGAAKERLQAIAAEIGKRAAAARGEAVDSAAANEATQQPAAEPAKDAPTSVPATSADAVPADLKEFMAHYIDVTARKDFDAILAMTHFPDPTTREIGTLFIPSMRALDGLDAAMKSKFNTTVAEASAGSPLAMMLKPIATANAEAEAYKSLSIDRLEITAKGDTASVKSPAEEKPIELRKVDGAWKVVPTELAEIAANPQAQAQAGMMKAMIASMTEVSNTIAADITAGKFADAQSAMQAFQAKMMQAMQGAMGGGEGPK